MLCDIDQGNHDPIDVIVGSAVGQQTHETEAIRFAAHFPLERYTCLQHGGGVFEQASIVQFMGNVGQRSPLIRGQHVEKFVQMPGKLLDTQLTVQKEGGDVRGGQQVLQIVVGAV